MAPPTDSSPIILTATKPTSTVRTSLPNKLVLANALPLSASRTQDRSANSHVTYSGQRPDGPDCTEGQSLPEL